MKCKVLGSVTELIIRGCPKLVNILEKWWPPMLRKLHLFDCEGLEALPGDWMTMGMEGNNTNTLCLLESMQISSCPSLIFLPKGELPTSLTRLRIANCECRVPTRGYYAHLPSREVGHLQLFISNLISKR